MEDARKIYGHDFSDPNYGAGWRPEASEYLHNLYASYGYKEDYSAQWIKKCIDALTYIGFRSRWRQTYQSNMHFLLEHAAELGTKPSTLQIVRSWLEESLVSLQD